MLHRFRDLRDWDDLSLTKPEIYYYCKKYPNRGTSWYPWSSRSTLGFWGHFLYVAWMRGNRLRTCWVSFSICRPILGGGLPGCARWGHHLWIFFWFCQELFGIANTDMFCLGLQQSFLFLFVYRAILVTRVVVSLTVYTSTRTLTLPMECLGTIAT